MSGLPFDGPLLRGTLLRRYKRFFADVELDGGTVVTAHCPNSGSMLSVCAPGSEVWLSEASNPARKLRYTWELIRVGDALVGINTARPNRIAANAVAAGTVAELAGYPLIRREWKCSAHSRIDLLLEAPDRPKCLVEVKNVTLRRMNDSTAPVEFPDATTQRGTKHLAELANAVAAGMRGVMLYIAHRPDALRLRFAADIDPAYAAAVDQAARSGVELLCYRCDVGLSETQLAHAIPIELPGRSTVSQPGVDVA